MGSGAKRPFWLHQAPEYLIGMVLVASGLQSPTPAVPAAVGGVVLLNTAITRGPLAAFRVVPVRVHRLLDLAVIAVTVAGAIQPWIEIDSGSQVVMVGVAVVHGFVWLQSAYVERPTARERRVVRAQRAAAPVAPLASVKPADRSEDLGRKAGRAIGVGVNMAKRAKARRDQSRGD